MKVPFLKEFGPEFESSSLSGVVRYLAIEMVQNLRELVNILKKLSFSDNFESFEFSGTIEASSELAIRNELRGGTIPSKRIIVRGNDASTSVVDGDSEWDANYVYLKNTHATDDAEVTVIFLK